MGRHFGPNPCSVKQSIQERYGGGKYSLRLIDSQGRMTKYKFILEIDGLSKLDDMDIFREQAARDLPCGTSVERRTLRRRIVNRVKVALRSLR